MKRRYWPFIAFLGILYVVVALLVCIELIYNRLELGITHWLTLAALVGASTQWALTSLLTLYSARRQHTINVLLQSRLSMAYQDRLKEVIKVYPTVPVVAKVKRGDWNEPEKVEALEGIKYLLNYFEFVAIGIRAGDLDEKTLHRSLGDIVIALTDVAEQYIRFVRGELPSNDGFPSTNAYTEVMWLKERWKKT
jgi:hypothetical protein